MDRPLECNSCQVKDLQSGGTRGIGTRSHRRTIKCTGVAVRAESEINVAGGNPVIFGRSRHHFAGSLAGVSAWPPLANCPGRRKRVIWLLVVAFRCGFCGWPWGCRFTLRLRTTRTPNCEPFWLVNNASLRRQSRLDCVTNRRSPRRRSVASGRIRWRSLSCVFRTCECCIMSTGTTPRWSC